MQPTLRGLSQFLVEHESCGAGFDISHPDGIGSGRVSMKCRGCGTTYEYATATIEFEREVEFAPVAVSASAPGAPAGAATPLVSPQDTGEAGVATPPAAAGIEASVPPQERATQKIPAVPLIPAAPPPPAPPVTAASPRGPRKPPKAKRGTYWTRDRKIVAGLLAFAAAALAFAAIRLAGGGDEIPTATTPPPSSAAAAGGGGNPKAKAAGDSKSKSQAAPARQPGAGQGEGGGASKQPSGAGSSTAARGEVEKVVETERFSLIVPNAWQEREAAGGYVLAPPGDAPVSVQVYYENDPGMSMATMVSQTRDFLRSRDIETKVQRVERLRVDGYPAFKLRAIGPAGTQVALGVLANPYRYLVIESLDPGAPEPAPEEAERALDTFIPR